ncbi:hypothetical protein IscW_ISCW021007 [Ixodes scapularis]|uniref:Uncharacterized protein n=1 Tax=Ixodes scapularis TaxID=6945 RepID=B7Q4T7_IXOSC|nr:hypothetical protein IscW_ISCW021007 [Ixodes scapularis]|eukprot:XP_002401073.1 hypothetical protein IscW_ISCW021007 [Ixodes scapularis]
MCRCSNLETNVTAKTTDSHQRCLWTRLVHFVCREFLLKLTKSISWSTFRNWSLKWQRSLEQLPPRGEKWLGCLVTLRIAPLPFPVMLPAAELVIRRYISVACAASPGGCFKAVPTIVLSLVKVSKIK